MVRNKLRKLAQRLITWALEDPLTEFKRSIRECFELELATFNRRSRAQVDEVIRQLDALQAVDVPVCRGSGKIIVIARVRDQDIVKILNIPPDMTMLDYKQIIREMEDRYGARAKCIDHPSPMIRDILIGGRQLGKREAQNSPMFKY